LIDQAVEQMRQAVGDRSAVAIVGPANVGKSTLYNQLIRRGQIRAEVSPVPGTTRVTQSADAGVFSIVDTPGTDAVGDLGDEERRKALAAAAAADVLVVLFDAAHGIRLPEVGLMAELRALDRPLVVALNKMDLVERHKRPEVIGRAAGTLGIDANQMIPISAKEAEGLERLLLEIARAEPAIVGALAAALPAYRWKLSQNTIARAASTSAAIAITPLPIIDFLPLLAVQTAMVLSIARIYQFQITGARARELIVTFGAGLLGRTLFYELSKLGGPPGWLVAAAVAVGTTAGLGYAAAVWFDRGTKLSGQRVRQIARAFSETVVERLKDLGRRRPGRKTLKQRIDEALTELPVPEGES
jgi:GTP-binding protein Era